MTCSFGNYLTASFILSPIFVVEAPNTALGHTIDFRKILESREVVLITNGVPSEVLCHSRQAILGCLENSRHIVASIMRLQPRGTVWTCRSEAVIALYKPTLYRVSLACGAPAHSAPRR